MPDLLPALARCSLVAVLRGLEPDRAASVGITLVECGFAVITLAVDCPHVFDSLAALAAAVGPAALVGAAGVTTSGQVAAVKAAGGRLVILPHGDPALVRTAKADDLFCLPGIQTQTEAHTALNAGADAISVYPTDGASPTLVRALRAVVPRYIHILPVGPIRPEGMLACWQAGATGFVLEEGCYRPGDDPATVAVKARRYLDAFAQLRDWPDDA